MTMTAIRQKLVDYMKVADYKKVKAVYALLEEEIMQNDRISIMQYNKELEEAEAEFVKGDYINHDAMKKLIKRW